jgi:hypothetical protein
MWYTSKWLWGNVVAIIILILQYSLNNNIAPASWVPYEGMALAVLNAIAGMIQSAAVRKLKATIQKLNADIQRLTARPNK